MNNAKGAATVSLELFGGLCSEVSASDLPEGASPLCYDCDFDIGRAKTRDPIQSVYTFTGNSAGPDAPTAAANSGSGLIWLNPTNILLNDGSYATYSGGSQSVAQNAGTAVNDSSSGLIPWSNAGNAASNVAFASASLGGGTSSQILSCSNFGFAIPANSVIVGVTLVFDSYKSGSAPSLNCAVTLNGGSQRNAVVSATSSTGFILGGGTDLWGTTLTPAIVNSPSFGPRIIASDTFGGSQPGTINLNSVAMTVFYTEGSQILAVTGFGFSLPAGTVPIGFQASVKGHYSGTVPTITVQALKAGSPVGTSKPLVLGTTDSTVTLGSSNDLWNTSWTQADINHPQFGVGIVASGGNVSLDYATITVFYAPTNSAFNYIKTFAQDDGALSTLALDAAGTLWKEDVLNAPNVLSTYDANILPGSFAKSATLSNEEWIAISNLIAGVDSPIHGSNLDRISQVGPGAGPACVGQAASVNVWNIAASPSGVTQPAANSDPDDPGHFQAVNWSAGPFSRSPGNVLTIFYAQTSHPQDSAVVVGGAVYLNMTSSPFTGLTGTYIVTSVGQGIPPGGAGSRWYFTVLVAASGNTFVGGPDTATGTYQITLATMTTTAPAQIFVNNRVTLAGVTITAWDGTWTILNTVNGAQIQITSTSLTSNVATYNYTLLSGSAPSAGQQVTVTGCTNGPVVNGTSIFNVSNYAIETAGVGTFTVSLNATNVSSAPENASGIIAGTIFQFDPGLSNLGAGVNAIFGNSGAGTVTTGGNLGAGVRQAVTIFITRNGFITAPSAPVVFDTSGATNVIQATNIVQGPPNVIGRIVAFTGANGGNFFYLPENVTISGAGQPVTYTATQINDNTTTSATFSFTDAVLLNATAIDIQGNNLFNQIELGPCAFAIPYAERMFYGLELNKVQNLTNTTFDGGYLPNQTGSPAPAGWTVDAALGSGGSIVASPIFGNAYYIKNSTGVTQFATGLIYQNAFQDAYQVPILLPNTLYSVRAKLRTPSSTTSGSLNVELYSPKFAKSYCAALFLISNMTSAFSVFTLPMVTTPFTTAIPSDLQLRVWAGNLPNNGDVEVDRFEVFPTNEPVLYTELQGSYAGNLEAFDGVTGPLGVGTNNNQAAIGAFTTYDQLYILKSNSMLSTKDSPGDEPADWTVREVSNKVGVCGINAYDYGEEWAVFAHRTGLWVFSGGEPQKISQEIQPTWDAINWTYGNKIWVRNDSTNRRMLIGVPMATPNVWLPNAPTNSNPTSPNVILALSYKDLNSVAALADRGPLHVSAFGGKLISWDMCRKWSIWQIPTNYADFVSRGDGSAPLFLCQGNATISQQSSSAQSDNGVPVDSLYTTYGFVQTEKEQQYGPLLGDHRKMAKYLELNISGNGNATVKALGNSLTATNYWQVPGGINLTSDPQNNSERPLNISGNRVYLQVRTNAVGANFQLSEAKLTLTADPWAPVRGVA